MLKIIILLPMFVQFLQYFEYGFQKLTYLLDTKIGILLQIFGTFYYFLAVEPKF